MVKEISAEQKATLAKYWVSQRPLPEGTPSALREGTFILPLPPGASPDKIGTFGLDTAQLIHDTLGLTQAVQGTRQGNEIVFKVALPKEAMQWLNEARTEWEQGQRATGGRSV